MSFSFFLPHREIRAVERRSRGNKRVSRCATGTREDVRGTERALFKMSGRLPRLRALRPRPQQLKTELHKEGNLKEDRQEVTMREHESRDNTEKISYNDKDDGSVKNNLKGEHDGLLDCSGPSQSYECKTCKPSKSLSSLKAYLDHLKKEHKQKVLYYYYYLFFF